MLSTLYSLSQYVIGIYKVQIKTDVVRTKEIVWLEPRK